MSNIIPFDSDTPAHLAQDAEKFNADLASHMGGGFPVLSIKGKYFAIKRDGTRTTIPNPKDPDSAATALEVVLVRVNKNKSKIFYAKGYKEGDDAKPDCFSSDGIKPDASVEKPQSKSCATCKNNVWGSKVSESGTKLKACSDSIRVAVAAPDAVDDPMLLRIPPASMKALSELANACNKRKVAYNAVVTRISFEPEASTPKLIMKPVGFLPPAVYKEVREIAESDYVSNIINGSGIVATDDDTPHDSKTSEEQEVVTEDEIDEAVAAAVTSEEQEQEEVEEKPKPKPRAKPATKPKAEPKPESKDVVDEIGDLDLSDIDFDD